MPGVLLAITFKKPHIFKRFIALSSVPLSVFTTNIPPEVSSLMYTENISKSHDTLFPITPDNTASYKGDGVSKIKMYYLSVKSDVVMTHCAITYMYVNSGQ